MRKYGTTLILILSIVIAESYSYAGKYAMVKQNWIYSVDRTMELQWNLKYAADQVNAILYFIAMFLYNKNRINKTTVVTFIILCFIDLVMYFHNFKTLHYGSVYVWTFIIWVILYYLIPKVKI